MNEFLTGAVMMACCVAGLFFLRFWRRTGDRFFAMFALAFWALALDRLGLQLLTEGDELKTLMYLLRFLAFLLILLAILDKNRSRAHAGRPGREP